MFDFKAIEEKILKFWEDKEIYEKVKGKNKKGEKFYFLQGPPFTSGKLHIGHAWNNSLKDIILRYKRMNGYNVWDRGGYDMHGLPTEHKVQKKLGIKTKEEIEKYGVDKFVKECIDWAEEHAGYMNEDLWRLAVWMDHEGAYKPIEKEYIGGQWAFFKKAWGQNRLYKGKKVMHWDAETETSLAKHELEYETIKDESIFLKFKRKDRDEYFVIWTTTPWTIPYNLAIMVNPELEYVRAKVGNEVWIIAKDLAGVFISSLIGEKLEILETFKGKDLKGLEYTHILNDELEDIYSKLKKKWANVHTIILSEKYVDTSAGTGLVHCAPGCGPEDAEVGEEYEIGAFNTLNERGEMENLGKYSGWVAKKDDKKFIAEFEKKGVLVAKSEIEHEYPHSWRSHEPVVFRATEQWFLKIADMVPKFVEMNKGVSWVPKKAGESHVRWTENLKDNSITRQRYWGCPIPLWINEEDEEDYFVVGSVEELEELTGKKFDDLTLHRPWIDKIIIEKDGKKYKRIPDVSDVWIDSGTASWNCLHNDAKLIEEWFPADLVLEGTEHTRLWFSMLQICSAIMFQKSCFKNVFAHGMILDFQGTKMSKSLGNIISPYEVIDKYSVDIFRNYICQITAGENINFNWDDIKVKQRNLLILGNIANYILDLERQDLDKGKIQDEDKWILSKMNSSIKEVTKLFEEYRLDETIGRIEELYLTLSRDYIKFVRNRQEKVVLDTIKKVYLNVLKMFSTVVPFISDDLWQKMGQKEESVHLCSWPKIDEKKIDSKLEKEFDIAMQIIESGLSIRDKEQIGLRWPLKGAKYVTGNKLSEGVEEIIKKQLNVKELEGNIKERVNVGVELDFETNEELEAEGFVREISRRVQAERKKRGLKKEDRIELKLSVDSDLLDRIQKFEGILKERTGSEKLDFTDDKSSEMVLLKVRDREIRFNF
ncbi:isoleucine--tRNA ligase [Candidatus Pacearchaeota archaeon CG10_big_fil_rev_8_21_14_0_10_35_219]|nr:isoleucine--tRNA ligase [Candidatus Pacearchaeota archaeon]OIO43343.1 MAG: isoleucine--tRNA ligase [Candidatus Pacearchaeota archaeon CG1_02_35_32]PIO07727.1 MAG: isoleucine--tRNA ligase [Candidatus Pacearchaeota archaeon CG10_big_fil_rev_8_21_14_0_10_35_219]PIY81491.1 MAG: isoleucine--tRNA ligase [Candidatus Pacearchaeota archaeon CG_4_10_14_0_8_um_filter_35_169]PIZ80423.1 MAG: isoleucine--tRNA ligase [Candidatus Pacearchaeota archaeon CG_4_10_14_0_2_um_filter_35_33]PJA69667.1 MAG: isoleuc